MTYFPAKLRNNMNRTNKSRGKNEIVSCFCFCGRGHPSCEASKRGTVHWSSRHGALVIAARCVGHRGTVCRSSRHGAFFCIAKEAASFCGNCLPTRVCVTTELFVCPNVPGGVFIRQRVTACNGLLGIDAQALGKHLCCLCLTTNCTHSSFPVL